MELIGRQTLFNFYLSLRKAYITFFQTKVSQTFSIHFCCSLQVNAYFWNQEVELSFKKTSNQSSNNIDQVGKKEVILRQATTFFCFYLHIRTMLAIRSFQSKGMEGIPQGKINLKNPMLMIKLFHFVKSDVTGH